MSKMKSFCYVLIVSFVVNGSQSINSSLNTTEEILEVKGVAEIIESSSSPLILTPYIKKGNLEKARNLSKVTLGGLESYSGYFTVNSKYNSNIFFWFFPAKNNPETAPLLQWIQGGPGSPSTFGLFVENGPFYIDENGKLNERSTSWGLNLNLIYMDSPVGTGFSFSNQYVTTSEENAEDLYEALNQFFKLFPEYNRRDFYLAGESYGAKFVLHLAKKIHDENQRKNSNIKLKGLAIGNGYFDPINAIYGKMLYNIGLIDEIERNHFETEEKKARKYIRRKKYKKANTVIDNLFQGDFTNTTYFKTVTGYEYYLNLLYATEPKYLSYYENFLNRPDIRQMIHVGNIEPDFIGSNVMLKFVGEESKSSTSVLVDLLEASQNYKVLIYNGNLDLVVPTISNEKSLNELKWKWRKCYIKSKKGFWKVKNQLAGYIKEFKNLMFLIVRNAGHLVPTDQPKHALDMINRFTSGISFDNKNYKQRNFFGLNCKL